jgi:signal transduction histidine kinase
MDWSLASTPLPSPAVPAAGPDERVDLHAPLPAELAGSHHGWFTRYRRYPVFSRPWALGRIRAWGTVLLLLALALIVVQILPLAGEAHSLVAAVGVALSLLFGVGVPLVLGPWLAWQVRRRAWLPQRELAALVAAFAVTGGLTLLLFQYARPPLKNAVSQWVEGADAGTTVVMLRMWVQREPSVRPDVASPGDAMVAEEAWWNDLTRYAAVLLLLAWLSGAMGLGGLRRERLALAELRQRHELQASRQARREAELRLSVLQAQVEPHFLFNTLAGVRSAVTGDPARAVEIVDRLVDYLRASIPRLRSGASEAEATLGAQLEVARAYLSLMHSRLLRLSFDVQADAGLLRARCPPLMLICLVENAVKHGIEPKMGPGCIRVDARRVQAPDGAPRLEVSVSDDGVGWHDGAMGGGLGLVNVREQLLQLYGTAAALRLQSVPAGGVCATLSLPLELESLTP